MTEIEERMVTTAFGAAGRQLLGAMMNTPAS